jgi:FMN phosphatase YigB (HAD superfamily)
LPSVRNRYPEATRSELVDYLAGPLEAFNSTREKTLQLYPGVRTTLARLQAEGFKIVGYTDAIFYNSYYRLVKLDIAQYLAHLYVLESFSSDHPKPDRPRKLVAPEGFAISVPLAERKPNPRLLLDVCHNERIGPAETIYVGDSITNDVAMALQAGVCAVWARYGRSFDPEYWKLLVEISHWTEDEVRRESELRKMFAHVHPDYVIDSFSQLLGLFGLTDQMSDE